MRALRFALLLALCLAYANSFQNGFHFDDFHTVVDNPAVRSLANVPRFFRDTSTFSVLPANRTYRPMVSASLALDYALGRGYKPFWFHATTFLLFLVLIALIEMLFRELMEKTTPSGISGYFAWFGAAWFGLHPVMAETVNYVIQRGDLYCTLGVVAALAVFARHSRLRRSGLYLLPLIFALLSKPPAVVFPVLLFFYVFFFEAHERRVRAGVLAALPSVAVAGGMLWLQAAMTPKTFLPLTTSAWDYRLTQPFVWLRYVGEFVLPLHLNVDSDLTAIHGIDLRTLVGLIFIVLLSMLIVYTARHRRLYPIAYGLIWFVVTQLPTSLYALSEVENDHRMFFSFVGLILAAVWTLRTITMSLWTPVQQQALRPAWLALAALLLGGYGYGVHVRNRAWFDEQTLWRDDTEKSPHNGRGLMNYGLTQMDKGAYPVALEYFMRALKFTPNYATLEVNLGIVEGAMADAPDIHAESAARAEGHFQRAISLAPEDDQPHAYYGRWLKDHGRAVDAVSQLETAVALNPQRPMQHDELIEAYAAEGDVVGALRAARQTLATMPDDEFAHETLAHPPVQSAGFWVNLSLAQYQSARYAESAASARRALVLDGNSAEAWNNLGAANAALRQWDKAIDADRKAIARKPGFQLARNNLAWALAQKKLATH